MPCGQSGPALPQRAGSAWLGGLNEHDDRIAACARFRLTHSGQMSDRLRSMTEQELAASAKTIIDSNRYMAIGTADESGQPWVTPVWFAQEGYREFVWVSRPGAQHSRNIAARPQVAIVIFDSQVSPGSAEAVYMIAAAEELPADELEPSLGVFAGESEAQGLSVWTRDNVVPPARHRLYRATVSEHFVLSPQDERLPVNLG